MMLDYRQQKYTLWLLTLLDDYFAKNILSITLRVDEGNAQSKDLPKNNRIWANHQKIRNYAQHLACQVSVQFCTDPVNGVESDVNLRDEKFAGKISIQEPIVAIQEA